MVSVDVVILATGSLFLQFFVLFLLVYAFNLKRKLKFALHGIVMTIAVLTHAASIFLVMIPSLSAMNSPAFVLPAFKEFAYMGSLIHGIVGGTAFALGIWLVAAWRFRKNVKGCFLRKKFMIVTFVLWTTSLIMGILIFGVLYGPTLIN